MFPLYTVSSIFFNLNNNKKKHKYNMKTYCTVRYLAPINLQIVKMSRVYVYLKSETKQTCLKNVTNFSTNFYIYSVIYCMY